MLNVHNLHMLSIWRANIDFQPVLSRHAVLNYISKYASKSESKSKSYHQMLSRLAQSSPLDVTMVVVIRKILTETVVDRDIGAQETCQLLLQKLPLTKCSHSFVSLNVKRIVFRRDPNNLDGQLLATPFLTSYMQRPPVLDSMSLIEVVRSWSFSSRRKTTSWKCIFLSMVIRILLQDTSIPSQYADNYVDFYWSELLLYCPFLKIA